jgi:hypothetical protein
MDGKGSARRSAILRAIRVQRRKPKKGMKKRASVKEVQCRTGNLSI